MDAKSGYALALPEGVDRELVTALEATGYHTLKYSSRGELAQLCRDSETELLFLSEDEFRLDERFYLQSGKSVLILSPNYLELQRQLSSDEYSEKVWVTSQSAAIEEKLYDVAKACIHSELRKQLEEVKTSVGRVHGERPFVAVSPISRELIAKAQALASYDSTILITGESGTGKTALAHYIHTSGSRAKKPFIAVSCASIPRDLLEAELFGHEKGAFTGATASRMGVFEMADGGTLFLDEVGDLPLELQPKLLTVLQDRVVRRVGSSKEKKVDVRIITATNKDLKAMCKEREFREDLFFRLNVVNLWIAPLRERHEDIEPLFDSLVQTFSEKFKKPKPNIDKDVYSLLHAYSWPGNVRELENIVERLMVLCEAPTIRRGDLKLDGEFELKGGPIPVLIGHTLESIERKVILDTLEYHKGDKPKTAGSLGISLKTLYNKLSRYQNFC